MSSLTSRSGQLSVSFVVPCCNEEAALAEFFARARQTAGRLPDCDFRYLFVDDGSTDETPAILDALARQHPEIQVLHLARNMGHQVALTAGLDFVTTDVAITIDCDLQDPPELALEMLTQVRAGYDIVHARRRRRAGETWFKLASATLFYRVLAQVSETPIVPDCGDFRAVTRPVLEVAARFREPHRFLRALFAGFGFRQAVIYYEREARRAGQTKFSIVRMTRLASDALLNNSAFALRFIVASALFAWAASLFFVAKALYEHFVLHITVAGWTSLVALVSGYSGLQLTAMGTLGAYVSRVFEQGQRRPLYWLRDAVNIDLAAARSAGHPTLERDLSLDLVGARRDLEGRPPSLAPLAVSGE